MTANPSMITDRLIDEAANLTDSTAVQNEKRSQSRHPFEVAAVLVLLAYDGQTSKPLPVRTVDISHGGMRVVSRHMIHPGATGAAQMMRSDGTAAIVGVRVMHCRYVGAMKHHTGLQFIPLSTSFSADNFCDKQGRPLVLECQDSGD